MISAINQPAAVRMALALLGACALWLLIAPLYRSGLWLELPNEGWNATHAMNAFGAALYPPRGSLIVNNYPPLWFYLTGALAQFGLDPIFAGRAIAFAAFVAVALAIYLILRGFRATMVAALVGAASFVMIVAGPLDSYVGLGEPQMLAHALVCFGAVVLLRAGDAKAAIVGAILTAIGLLTKQVVIALPLASLVWLLLYRRHLLRPWLMTGAAVGLAAFAACYALYGQNFLANMLFPRVLSLSALGKNVALITKPAVPLVVFGAVAWSMRRSRDEAMTFAGLAIAAGLLVLVLLGSAHGVSINIAFDLVIAAAIGLGLASDRIAAIAGAKADAWRIAISGALIARVAIGVPYASVALPFDARERARLQEQSSTIVALRDRLKAARGPVACEHLSACHWAGHRNDVDLWKLHYETTIGPFMDTQALRRRIADGQFGAMTLFGASNPVIDRDLPGLADALAKGYGQPQVFGGSASLFVSGKSR